MTVSRIDKTALMNAGFPKVELVTKTGGHVTFAYIPLMNPIPELLVWGSRLFFRKDVIAAVYVEGIAWHVQPGHTDHDDLVADQQEALEKQQEAERLAAAEATVTDVTE